MTKSPESPRLIRELQARAEAGRIDLPVLPAVATEVLSHVNSDDCDVRSLADLVQRDPSMAANVLRVANSAMYAPVEPIVSLTQAIGRLGLSTLRDIVMSLAVEGAVFDVAGHDEYVTKAWRHAHASGKLAQEIARMRRSNVEASFLCGLLHDVGTPVILQGLVDICREEGLKLDTDMIEDAVGALHQEMGGQLIEKWGLPAWVRDCALHHHLPAAATEYHDFIETVALADVLTHWILDDDCEGVPPGLEHAEALDLYDEDLDELQERASEILSLAS